MRPSYDPDADCTGPSSAGGVIHVTWIAEAVQILVGIASAYQTMQSSSGDMSKLLAGISDSLEDIRRELSAISKTLDRILDMLYDLPRIIRGEMDRALVKQSLGEADGIVALIQDYSSEKKIAYEPFRVELQRRLDDLSVKLNGVVAINGRGITTMLTVAPYLTAWLGGSVALEKWKRHNDAAAPIFSPWDRNFLKTTQTMYATIFTDAEQQDQIYDGQVIPHMPPHDVPLALVNGHFVKQSGSGGFPGHLPQPGDYRIKCRQSLDPERLEAYQGGPVPGQGGWKQVSANDTPATAAYDRLKTERIEIATFYSLVPQIYARKSEVLGAFVEPAGFWS